MKFAEVDGVRCEATISGQRGICLGCKTPVVAKCGQVKVNHWAHLSGKDCDSWHEPETEWHRRWKNLFPVDWQEKTFVDEKSGEHHRADVHTAHGLTIEFQHSAIKPEECEARELFYRSQGSMVWVVDGTRTKSIWKQFNSNRQLLFPEKKLPSDTLTCRAPEKLFPREWIDHPIPVFFDFVGCQNEDNLPIDKQLLVCLFPRTESRDLLVRLISHANFVSLCKTGDLAQWTSIKHIEYRAPVLEKASQESTNKSNNENSSPKVNIDTPRNPQSNPSVRSNSIITIPGGYIVKGIIVRHALPRKTRKF